MSQNDKIEISGWLDAELSGGLPFRSHREDRLQRSGEIERPLKFDDKASGPTIEQRR